MPNQRLRVAIALADMDPYSIGVLWGFGRGLHLHGGCEVVLRETSWEYFATKRKRCGRIDAMVICSRGDRKLLRQARAVRAPVVDVTPFFVPDLPWPQIIPDDAAVGAAVAHHFLERDFVHFGFVGLPPQVGQWQADRLASFAATVEASGHRTAVHLMHTEPAGEAFLDRDAVELATWLASLPKPVGIMAAADRVGLALLTTCRHLDIRVPDEIAVVGVDDLAWLCETSEPTLSSVPLDGAGAGQAALTLLLDMVAGQAPETAVVRVPPRGIAVRRSSDVIACTDRDIAQAMHFIREHAIDGISVEDVLGAVALSRRGLESRFKNAFGSTPYHEILRTRIARAQRLLTETDLSIAAVARSAAFSSPVVFSTVFRREVGMTASAYRKKFRRPLELPMRKLDTR